MPGINPAMASLSAPLTRRIGVWIERLVLEVATLSPPSLLFQGETLAPLGALAVTVEVAGPTQIAGETLAPTGTITVTRSIGYLPPVGIANLNLENALATLPDGVANLNLGLMPAASLDRTAIIAGDTYSPTGTMGILQGFPVRISGETRAPTGAVIADYDPNLLSDVVRAAQGDWQTATGMQRATQEAFRDTPFLPVWLSPTWQDAMHQSAPQRVKWRDSPVLMDGKRPAWTDGFPLSAGPIIGWQDSTRLTQDRRTNWQDALRRTTTIEVTYRARLTLLPHARIVAWRDGFLQSCSVTAIHQEGLHLVRFEVERWQEAGYPGNAPNPGPPLPIPVPWPWGSDLNLRCPLPTSPGRIHLNIGRSPCILVAEREVPFRRSYMSFNSATLVRWPDLVPLPVTAMTIETDFDSWCWALTATLAGPDAWALVQPNPLACEVQATINGQVWRFLLDVPNLSRSFNQNRVTLKGRSRSAWLHDPFTPSRNMTQPQARDMTQLAALAVENTGWSVDWRLEDWVVPAGRYNSQNTPIGTLIRLANVTDDGVYTHPTDQIITMHKRWPVASWLLDGETMDLLIPDSAILSLTQSPVYSQPYNGVYVSGTSHGVLALVKIEGTDGTLQPDEPITNELLCDANGVAARQRGLNALSDSGAGWEMDAETLFNPTATPAFPLVPPGQIVSIAGLKGISRSCRITAQRSGNALSVRQSIGIERREVEA